MLSPPENFRGQYESRGVRLGTERNRRGLAPLFWPNLQHSLTEVLSAPARAAFVNLCIDVMHVAYFSWLKQALEDPSHCSSSALRRLLTDRDPAIDFMASARQTSHTLDLSSSSRQKLPNQTYVSRVVSAFWER